MTYRTSVLVVVSLAVAWAQPALSADYYVDGANPAASDQNNGSQGSPWRTLYAIEAATLQPGDNVIVRPGIYDVSQGGTWEVPAIQPSSSGTSSSPITIRSEVRHGAILDGGGAGGGLIGTRGDSNIVIEGFVVQNTTNKGIAIFASNSVIVRDNIVRQVINTKDGDNTEAIRIEDSNNIRIENNLMYNIRNTGSTNFNASGIKQYRTTGVVIEHNEVHSTNVGFFDKDTTSGTVIRRNYIHDVATGIVSRNNVSGIQITENIVRNSLNGIVMDNENQSTMSNVGVWNNTIVDYTQEGISMVRYPGSSTVRVWNNIFARSSSPSLADVVTFDDPPTVIVLMNYNLFPSQASFVVGQYSTSRQLSGLSAWRNYTSLDAASISGDAAFSGSTTQLYQLSATSPAKASGRVGGVASGAAVDMGAYPNGVGVVGLLGGGVVRPNPPTAFTAN